MSTLLDDFKNAFRRGDNALTQLILINGIVFLVLNIFRIGANIGGAPAVGQWLTNMIVLPAAVEQFIFRPWTLVTYFFAHTGLFHIFFNMLFLYYFGQIIKEYLGSHRLVNLYVLGGLSGGLLYLVLYNLVPFYSSGAANTALLGASGAVYAVVVGAATLMPNLTFSLILIGPVRIVYIAIFFVLTSFIAIDGANAGGNMAHLGGALIGFVFIRQLQRGRDIGQPVEWTLNFFRGLFRKKPRLKVTHREPRTAAARPNGQRRSGKPNQEEIDEILDKISRSGYDSLTKEEKQKLFSASQKD